MPTDFCKFPFSSVSDPFATTLTQGITTEPINSGFIVVTFKLNGDSDFVGKIRAFAKTMRESTEQTGLVDIAAFREFNADELGGAIPFDQPICEAMLNDAKRRQGKEAERFPGIKLVTKMMEGNEIADWVLMMEFKTVDQASAAASAWRQGDNAFAALTRGVAKSGINVFRNTRIYASVSRDPNVIQFFNLFPGPGDAEKLWPKWQEALPWFLEVGEFRSSFPLVATDNNQPLLIVNYAHVDSVKHFMLGVAYDPNFLETVTRCYADQGFMLPLPFFCKIVSV